MVSINDNDFKNKELDEKVDDFIRPKLDEINKNIDALVESAKVADLDVSTIQDVLNLELPESQEEYNFVADLQKCAKDLSKEKILYEFLTKDDQEVETFVIEDCSTERLKLCKEKIDLYKQLGHTVEGDKLEELIRNIAKKRGVKKKTLDELFGKKKPPENKTSQFKGMSHKEIIDGLNQKHAEMIEMKEYMILLESNNGKLQFQREADFKKTYQHEVIGVDEKNHPITVADLWLKSFDKRRFNDIAFNPDPDRTFPEKDYNLWKGFAFEPEEGDVSVFENFTREVICSSNERYFNYIWAWLARMIQKPHEPAETAIVLKGKQGTGKNTFVETVGKLLGNHFSPLSSIEQLLGRFDFHHANAILLHANEAIWGGDRRMLGKLKTLITERYVTVEQKHRDPITLKNCRHMIFSSNEDWPVHIDRDDRRFFVLEISDKYKENTEYFKKIHDWAGSGGLEALLYHFQNYDISNFNFRNLPQSASAFQIKLDSACSTEVYIYEALKVGQFGMRIDDEYLSSHKKLFWGNEPMDIPKNNIYEAYSNWCLDQKMNPESNRKLGRSLKKLIGSTKLEKKIREEDSIYHIYGLPMIEIARKEFEESYKAMGMIDWDEVQERGTEKKDLDSILSC